MYHAFSEAIAERSPDYKLTSCGCLGPCESGVTVLVYPGGTVYGRVGPGDVLEIVEQHLVAGHPVDRLVVQDAQP